MTDIAEHLPGRASWIDLGTPDLPAAAAFYTGLFGWDIQDLGPEAGNYRMCFIGGRPVAGIGPQQNTEASPYWTTYFCVESVEASAAKITAAGGRVIVSPMDVMDSGRMAVALDPTGATFSLWQPLNHKGIGVHSVLGTRCWSELMTRDLARSSKFYAAVFGWDIELNEVMHYTMLELDGEQVGGILLLDDQFPAEITPQWVVYFYTEDIAATVATARALGASVTMPPTPIEGIGQFAVLCDAQGAAFNLLQPGS